MKLSTVVINTIEMTREEEEALWNTEADLQSVCGKPVKHWLAYDGQNEILLLGETTYRSVVIVKKD